jgi:hypothetical protein
MPLAMEIGGQEGLILVGRDGSGLFPDTTGQSPLAILFRGGGDFHFIEDPTLGGIAAIQTFPAFAKLPDTVVTEIQSIIAQINGTLETNDKEGDKLGLDTGDNEPIGESENEGEDDAPSCS